MAKLTDGSAGLLSMSYSRWKSMQHVCSAVAVQGVPPPARLLPPQAISHRVSLVAMPCTAAPDEHVSMVCDVRSSPLSPQISGLPRVRSPHSHSCPNQPRTHAYTDYETEPNLMWSVRARENSSHTEDRALDSIHTNLNLFVHDVESLYEFSLRSDESTRTYVPPALLRSAPPCLCTSACAARDQSR